MYANFKRAIIIISDLRVLKRYYKKLNLTERYLTIVMCLIPELGCDKLSERI